MKNSLNMISNLIVDLGAALDGKKFKSYADYEKFIKKAVGEQGGDKLQEALKSLPPLPNVEEHFYKSIANKVREMVNIKFE